MPTAAKPRRPLDQPDDAFLGSDEPLSRMSFGDHLDELRKRLIAALLGAAVGVLLCFYFAGDIIAFLVQPYRIALLAAGFNDQFLTLGPAELIITYLGVALKAGLVLSSPWVIYQIWKFIGAGLYARERKIVYKYIGPSVLMFFLGVAFFYFIALPVTLSYFSKFPRGTNHGTPQPTWIEKMLMGIKPIAPTTRPAPATQSATAAATEPDPGLHIPMLAADPTHFSGNDLTLWYNVTDQKLRVHVGDSTLNVQTQEADALFNQIPRLDDYLSFVTLMALIFGAMFELPMVVMVVAQLGLVTVPTLRKYRKVAYFGSSIAAMIAAPSPDLLTMMTIMLPLIGLYEFGLILARIVVGKQAAADAEMDADES
jgi:sec-independent protein translocase protein TatC